MTPGIDQEHASLGLGPPADGNEHQRWVKPNGHPHVSYPFGGAFEGGATFAGITIPSKLRSVGASSSV